MCGKLGVRRAVEGVFLGVSLAIGIASFFSMGEALKDAVTLAYSDTLAQDKD
jgi:hypothetical protein